MIASISGSKRAVIRRNLFRPAEGGIPASAGDPPTNEVQELMDGILGIYPTGYPAAAIRNAIDLSGDPIEALYSVG